MKGGGVGTVSITTLGKQDLEDKLFFAQNFLLQ